MYIDYFELPIDEEHYIVKSLNEKYVGPYKSLDNVYPCGLFSQKNFREIFFKKVTIFYGGNGSGKSTLLNLISEKLELNRIAPFNSSTVFPVYAQKCNYKVGYDDEGFKHKIPDGSRIISSDDIFDYMLTVRTNNSEILDKTASLADDYLDIKYGDSVRVTSLDDYEKLRVQILSRKRSVCRKNFIEKVAGKSTDLYSNGETALNYFKTKLKSDKLYCLDEPENSMSPKSQLQLKGLLEQLSRYCGCQFIIATHSPFILSIDGAKIYNLDSSEVEVDDWWKLENVKVYYEFFKKHENLFK